MHPSQSETGDSPTLSQQLASYSLLSSHRSEHDPILELKTRPHTAPRRCQRPTHAQNQNSTRPSSSHALNQRASPHPDSPSDELHNDSLANESCGGKFQRESTADEKGCDRQRRYFGLGTRAPGSPLHPSFAGILPTTPLGSPRNVSPMVPHLLPCKAAGQPFSSPFPVQIQGLNQIDPGIASFQRYWCNAGSRKPGHLSGSPLHPGHWRKSTLAQPTASASMQRKGTRMQMRASRSQDSKEKCLNDELGEGKNESGLKACGPPDAKVTGHVQPGFGKTAVNVAAVMALLRHLFDSRRRDQALLAECARYMQGRARATGTGICNKAECIDAILREDWRIEQETIARAQLLKGVSGCQCSQHPRLSLPMPAKVRNQGLEGSGASIRSGTPPALRPESGLPCLFLAVCQPRCTSYSQSKRRGPSLSNRRAKTEESQLQTPNAQEHQQNRAHVESSSGRLLLKDKSEPTTARKKRTWRQAGKVPARWTNSSHDQHFDQIIETWHQLTVMRAEFNATVQHHQSLVDEVGKGNDGSQPYDTVMALNVGAEPLIAVNLGSLARLSRTKRLSVRPWLPKQHAGCMLTRGVAGLPCSACNQDLNETRMQPEYRAHSPPTLVCLRDDWRLRSPDEIAQEQRDPGASLKCLDSRKKAYLDEKTTEAPASSHASHTHDEELEEVPQGGSDVWPWRADCGYESDGQVDGHLQHVEVGGGGQCSGKSWGPRLDLDVCFDGSWTQRDQEGEGEGEGEGRRRRGTRNGGVSRPLSQLRDAGKTVGLRFRGGNVGEHKGARDNWIIKCFIMTPLELLVTKIQRFWRSRRARRAYAGRLRQLNRYHQELTRQHAEQHRSRMREQEDLYQRLVNRVAMFSCPASKPQVQAYLAARRVQCAIRCHQASSWTRRFKKAVRTIQTHYRRCVGGRAAAFRLRVIQLRWQREQVQLLRRHRFIAAAVAEPELEILESYATIEKKMIKLRRELGAQQDRAEVELEAAARKLKARVLAGADLDMWVPQVGCVSGKAHFLNTLTGEVVLEHPHKQRVQGLVKELGDVVEAQQRPLRNKMLARLEALKCQHEDIYGKVAHVQLRLGELHFRAQFL